MLILALCYITNLIECMAMFDFIKGLSVFRIHVIARGIHPHY